MKLKHLLQAYKVNNIEAELKEMDDDREKAGVIIFNDSMSASYLLDDEDIVVSMVMFFNTINTPIGTKTPTITQMIDYTIKIINIIQNTIMLLSNISKKEAN